MIRKTIEYVCDACGKRIDDYKGHLGLNQADEEGCVWTEGLDFCKECMKSFNEWRYQRKTKQ